MENADLTVSYNCGVKTTYCQATDNIQAPLVVYCGGFSPKSSRPQNRPAKTASIDDLPGYGSMGIFQALYQASRQQGTFNTLHIDWQTNTIGKSNVFSQWVANCTQAIAQHTGEHSNERPIIAVGNSFGSEVLLNSIKTVGRRNMLGYVGFGITCDYTRAMPPTARKIINTIGILPLHEKHWPKKFGVIPQYWGLTKGAYKDSRHYWLMESEFPVQTETAILFHGENDTSGATHYANSCVVNGILNAPEGGVYLLPNAAHQSATGTAHQDKIVDAVTAIAQGKPYKPDGIDPMPAATILAEAQIRQAWLAKMK